MGRLLLVILLLFLGEQTLLAQEVIIIAPEGVEDLAKPPTYGAIINQMPIEDLRMTAQGVWRHGLSPNNYWTPEMERAYLGGGDFSRWLKPLANDRYLKLVMDVYTGAIDPSWIGSDVKVTRKTFLTTKQFQAVVIANGTKADLVVEALAVKSPPYKSLQVALAKVYPSCSDGSWPVVIAPKKSLKFTKKDKSIPAIKARLAFMGYAITNQSDVFDQEMLNAISDLQWTLKFKPDGVISPRGPTMRFLLVLCMDRVRQIQADMEKMRWFPTSFDNRYVFVNTAFSYFALVDKNIESPVAMSFQVINGRAERKTPTMKDKLVQVILNPFWVVPPTIFIEDKVEELRWMTPNQVRAYFISHNYEAWNQNFTRKLDPGLIDWWSMGPDTDKTVFIRQKPHLGNALGVVKFMLTNYFSIYLHDTNQRELFAEPRRQLSSGCIRLEKPFDLAEYLLRGTEWTREKIEATVAKPGEVLDKSTKIDLSNPIPVYIIPLTTQLTSDGILRFVEDVYDHNRAILYYIGSL